MPASNKPVIVMLIPNYGHGGAQRIFSQLVNILSKQYQLIKVVFNNDQLEAYPASAESVSLNIKAGSNIISKALQFLKRCWRMYLIKKQYSPKYTISHLEGANFVNVLSFGKGKTILYVHGSKLAEDTNRQGLVKLIENKLLTPFVYNLAFKIVTVSREIAFELKSVYKIKEYKLNPIHNPINSSCIIAMSTEPLIEEEKHLFNNRTLVFVGRLVPQKNPLALISIYKKLTIRNQTNLLVIGDGPLKAGMIEKCIDLGLSYQVGLAKKENEIGRVIFIGFQDNPFKYLKYSRIFILTSDFEGFPLAPCEAMALGVPVISTDCPTGVRELLGPELSLSYQTRITTPTKCNYGILMPLVTNSDSISTWAHIVEKQLLDMESTPVKAELLKERIESLSEDNYEKVWRSILT